MATKSSDQNSSFGATCDKTSAKVNSKNCGQCNQPFKKNQKSLNCNVCNYWFCLDCSHVPVKMYDMLRSQSCVNLPFNCDGCLRVLPKLTEMVSQLNNQSKRYDECNQKIKDLEGSIDEKIEKQVEKAIELYRDREDRKCNVIFHNIPESFCENKKEEDGRKLRDVLAVMKCNDIEPKAFVRLGRPIDGKQRLTKVILDSVTNKHQLLGGAKLLRAKDGDGNSSHGWSNIFVTPDLTKEERERSRLLRIELGKRKSDEENLNLVIYRGKIIDRKDISDQGKDKGPGNGLRSRPVLTA